MRRPADTPVCMVSSVGRGTRVPSDRLKVSLTVKAPGPEQRAGDCLARPVRSRW